MGDPTPILQSQPSKNEALRALLTDQQSRGERYNTKIGAERDGKTNQQTDRQLARQAENETERFMIRTHVHIYDLSLYIYIQISREREREGRVVNIIC